MLRLFFLFVALTFAQAPLGDRLEKGGALIDVAKEGPLPASELKAWQALLPRDRVAVDASRPNDLIKWVKRELGLAPKTRVEIERVPTRAKGGHEVYRVRFAEKKVILKIFLGAERFDEVLREVSADELLRKSATQLKGIRILALGILNDEPAIIMEAAPGESIAKLLARDFVLGKKGIAAASRALADFHQKVKRSVDPKSVPAEITEYRSREHRRKIRRWISAADKPTSTLESLRKKGWLNAEEVSLLKERFERAFEAYESKPITSATIVHGDGHPKNLYYDSNSNQVTAIDTAFMGWTLRAVGDPMEDLGRAIEGSLLVAVQSGMPEARFLEILSAWVKNYSAPVDADAVRYYRLRFLQLLMDGEPFTREQARALLNPYLHP